MRLKEAIGTLWTKKLHELTCLKGSFWPLDWEQTIETQGQKRGDEVEGIPALPGGNGVGLEKW